MEDELTIKNTNPKIVEEGTVVNMVGATSAPVISAPVTKGKTPFTMFPYCPIRVGRIYDADPDNPKKEAVVTCGYEPVTVEKCVKCDFQRSLKENHMGNDLKIFKNSKDVERLKVELSDMQDTVVCLMFVVAMLLQEKFAAEGVE